MYNNNDTASNRFAFNYRTIINGPWHGTSFVDKHLTISK